MSGSYGENPSYRFGEFVLDVGRGRLHRNGAEISLRPRSFDVLRYLVEHPGRLVSRDELMDALWQGTVVTEDAVTQCVIDIRRALDDDQQEMIRTVPRRGYLLELAVERVDSAEQVSAHSPNGASATRRTLITTLVIGVAVVGALAMLAIRDEPETAVDTAVEATIATGPSIAVMPFENMGPDSQRSYFADGVSEEIINSLARQNGLRVIARTSSFSFRDQNYDVNTIAARLDVSHVLEGSVRNDGDSLRINVQLVDAGSGEYVWNEQFDRELSAASVFAIQTEIATAVVESLQKELTPEERARLVRVPTDNIDALNAYFEARQAMESRRPDELRRANALLRRAIELDDQFALAYVALADTLRLQSNYGTLSDRAANEQGMLAVRRALKIDDRLGEAYASLGNILARSGDHIAAEEAFLRGIELSPSYAPLFQWYGQFLWTYLARAEEAVTYSRIAAALDPRSAVINVDYSTALRSAGRYDEALAQIDKVIDIDPDFARGYSSKAILLWHGFGRFTDAIALLERAESLVPESPYTPAYLARAYVDLGDMKKAAIYLDEAERRAPDNPTVVLTRFLFHAINDNADIASESAKAVLEHWPWHVLALRYLRDEALAEGDVDQAIEYYRPMFGEFFGEDAQVVNLTNFAAAIDVSYILLLAGRRDRAEQLLEESLQFVDSKARRNWSENIVGDVKIQAILGNHDKALELLSAAVDDGFRALWRFELEHDLALAKLAKESEYRRIVAIIEADMDRQRQQLDNDSRR